MTTTRKLTISETGSLVQKPVAVLAAQRIDAVVGSIIQLDGRKSYDPNKKKLYWRWHFSRVPIGSLLEDSSFRDIRPNSAAVSFTPDKTGFYVVELTVSNEDLVSDPITATIGIQVSSVPCGENIVPEARFFWDYISNFWSLVEDREVITSIWSSTMQLIGAELVKLWAADYDKSISTIQSNHQRRWQKFSAVTDLSGYLDQRIIVGKNDSGTNGYTGTPGVRAGSGTTSLIYVPLGAVGSVTKTDFSILNGNYGPKGRVIIANGQCYTIQRVATVPLQMCKGSDGSTASNQLTSLSADFVSSGVQTGDELSISSGLDAGNYLVSSISATVLGVTQLNGSSVSFLGSSGAPYVVTRYYTSAGVSEKDVPDGEINVSWRVPNLLHVPGLDLESLGVRAGDVLVFDVTRKDTGLSAEIRAQVVGVRGSRLGFEFDVEDLVPGDNPYSKDLFRQLVRDLTIAPPEWSDTDAAKAAEAFMAFMPIGVNLNTRPFSIYRIIFKAKKIIHNNVVVSDSTLVSVPALQECPKDPPVVLRENLDYVVDSGEIQFVSGIFTPSDPSPETWWGECAFYDNSQTIENNFGRLVGLLKEDFDLKNTKTSYLSAVKGLFYSYTNGPTVANIRLGLQILLGLPFSEERGVILEISPYFSKDAYGNDLGRILIEDVDDNDRRIGLRRFYFYPMSVGLEVNSSTGLEYTSGDLVNRFAPLSKGVSVTDYVKDPYWWKRALYGMEILKFFTFYVSVDSDIFSSAERSLAFDFISQIKATYTNVLVAAIRELEDDIEFEHSLGGYLSLALYDSPTGIEAVKKTSDSNGQGATLWTAGYSKNYTDDDVYYPDEEISHLMADRSYHTRTLKMLKDVRIYDDSGTYKAYTSTGWGSFVRGRTSTSGSPTLPILLGDLLVVSSNQGGSYRYGTQAYEIFSIVDANTVILRWADIASDFHGVTTDLEDVVEGENLLCSVVRREINPLIVGADLQTSSSNNIVTSSSAYFISNSVGSGDILVIESATNRGDYFIEALTSASPGPPFVPPSISETQVRLVNKDGSVPTFAAATDLRFRVIRPSLIPRMVSGCHSKHESSLVRVEALWSTSTLYPQDAFTPGMVGTYIPISRSYDIRSDGRFLVNDYGHAGRLFLEKTYISGLDEILHRRAVVHLPDQTEDQSLRISGLTSVNNYLNTGSGQFTLDPTYSGTPFSFEGPPGASPLMLGVLSGDKLLITGPVGAPNTGKTFTITAASGTTLTVYEAVTSDPTTSYEYTIERRKS